MSISNVQLFCIGFLAGVEGKGLNANKLVLSQAHSYYRNDSRFYIQILVNNNQATDLLGSFSLSLSIYIYIYIYTRLYSPPSPQTGFDHSKFLRRVKVVWIENYPSPRLVVFPRLNNPVYTLTTHSREEIRWIHAFSNVFAWSEMQRALFRIWTQIDTSISYYNNHYTKHTYTYISLCLFNNCFDKLKNKNLQQVLLNPDLQKINWVNITYLSSSFKQV